MHETISKFIENNMPFDKAAEYGIYPVSCHTLNGRPVFMANEESSDVLIAPSASGFSGQELEGTDFVVCPLNHENALKMRQLFPFTSPTSVLSNERTFGVGDRLGIATEGHIRVFKKFDAYPIFAQQSIRELTLTNRTFDDVLDCVSFAVFRENFTRPFGADGDHLKTFDEVRTAIACGYTMITLDCSEHIRNDVQDMTDEEVAAAYEPDVALEEKYLNKTFHAGDIEITYDKNTFMRICLIYNKAIEFASSVYHEFFTGEDPLDFEVSIDETATPTSPAQHFYVANELFDRGAKPATIAPRFCGDFQKGIDYIGDLVQFEKEFAEHAAIADHFGYKISVHSGSDKFSVFEIVGKYTHGRFHVKTAGTNWLEAMAIVAEHCPELYREVHEFALETGFNEARKYYHVTTDLEKIPPLNTLTDAELPKLFEQNDARQLIHITYGEILRCKNDDGSFRFRDRLYNVWRKYSEEYAVRLDKHISHHMQMLYDGFSSK